MHSIQEKVIIIVPCYNEADRLDLTQFNNFHENVYFLFVNDGSTDDTYSFIEKNLPSNSYVLNLEQNGGKAEAVRQGALYSKTLPIFDEVSWIGFWDADLATPLKEISWLLQYNRISTPPADSVWASRIYMLGSTIKRKFKRHYLGRFFATVVGVFLKIKTYDSQCGAKLFKKNLIDQAFGDPFISSWIFDIEILMRLSDVSIIECPVKYWEDIAGSKINVFKTSFTILKDIYNIRKKYLKS